MNNTLKRYKETETIKPKKVRKRRRKRKATNRNVCTLIRKSEEKPRLTSFGLQIDLANSESMYMILLYVKHVILIAHVHLVSKTSGL